MNYNFNLKALKKESKENREECMALMQYGKSFHPKMLLIDATLNERGKPNFTVYGVPGDEPLQLATNKALDSLAFQRDVLSTNGRTFFVLVDDDDTQSMDQVLDLTNDGVVEWVDFWSNKDETKEK